MVISMTLRDATVTMGMGKCRGANWQDNARTRCQCVCQCHCRQTCWIVLAKLQMYTNCNLISKLCMCMCMCMWMLMLMTVTACRHIFALNTFAIWHKSCRRRSTPTKQWRTDTSMASVANRQGSNFPAIQPNNLRQFLQDLP